MRIKIKSHEDNLIFNSTAIIEMNGSGGMIGKPKDMYYVFLPANTRYYDYLFGKFYMPVYLFYQADIDLFDQLSVFD
jgi:hypothetical protein